MEHKLVIFAGPSGVGKNAIINEILKRIKNSHNLVTSTTRKMRVNEKDGEDYFFLDNKTFEEKLKNKEVIGEYFRQVTNSWYGILVDRLEYFIKNYDMVLGDVQIVGARILKEKYNATTIFILPDSLENLEKRIRERSPLSEEEIKERLQHTKREMEEDMPFYDYKVVNGEGRLEETVHEVLKILKDVGFVFETK
jgi:guanylate kinase